jgi:DNA repair photolyase
MASSPHEFFPPPGRGTPANPANRFERLHLEVLGEDVDALLAADPEAAQRRPRTEVFRDHAATILRRNDSPDLRFDVSLNPYRGCEHGCAYCYARPYHEYLGFSAGLDFETRILAKEDAPVLLRRELSAPSWRPQPVACSGITDCYQPVERRLRITRACLEVLRDFRNPVSVITKNHLVTRDIDLLTDLAAVNAAAVLLSVTTLDADLARDLEPRASAPAFRLRAIRELADAGIPVGVSVAPLIPGLNDHEAPAILRAARDHGATFAVWAALRLPHGVGELFLDWMASHRPSRRQSVENSIRRMRQGDLNQNAFGERLRGTGTEAEALARLFDVARRRAGLASRTPELSTASFRRVSPGQPELF